MVRFITLTLFFALIISFVFAQDNPPDNPPENPGNPGNSGPGVTVIHTPIGNITRGVSIQITWETNGPTSEPGTLNVINNDTQNTTTISNNLDLNTKAYNWTVNVSPGTYFFTLNSGAGAIFSGHFNVVEPTTSTTPPGPAPPAGAAPPPGPGPKGPTSDGPKGPKGPASNGPTSDGPKGPRGKGSDPGNPPIARGLVEGPSSNPLKNKRFGRRRSFH